MTRVSVVIFTWNDGAIIADSVAAVRALGADEAIVTDGGSNDGTMACPPGPS